MEKEVVSYIQEAREHGLSDLEIKKNLLDAGWEAGVVEDSFSHVRAQENMQPKSPLPTEPPRVAEQARSAALAGEKEPSVSKATETAAPEPSPTVQPLVELSEKHFLQPTSGKNHKWLWVAVGAVAGIAILASGGYYYYTKGFSSPVKVWEKYVQGGSDKVYENKFQWSYQDNGSLQKEDNKALGIELKNMRIGFDGVFYVDNTDPTNPQSSSDVQYTFASGNTSFSTGLKYRLVNKSLYVNIGENPFMDAIFNSFSDEGKRYDWIKIDLEELDRQAASSTNSSDEQLFKDVFSDDFVKQLQKIWEDSSFVKVDKYIGKDSVNGNSTLHFKNTLDKDAVKRVAFEYIDKIAARYQEVQYNRAQSQLPTAPGSPSGLSTSQDDVNKAVSMAKAAVEELVNKLEIKEFETWIGLKDFKLYKVHLVSNAPSLISALKLADEEYNAGFTGNTADAKRLADMRQLASALELYYNDNLRYPESKDGVPQGLAPNYIGQIPQAPEPAGGTCTPYYNTYWYEVKNTAEYPQLNISTSSPYERIMPSTPSTTSTKPQPGSFYQYTFCLGGDTGGYSGGIAMLTPAGIFSNITCPGKQEDCVNPDATITEKSDEDKLREFIQKLEFNGEMKIDADYMNYGKTKELEKPAEYFDLLDAIKKQEDLYQSYGQPSPIVFREGMRAGYLLSKYLK